MRNADPIRPVFLNGISRLAFALFLAVLAALALALLTAGLALMR